MADKTIVTAARGTAWGAVLGGWLATIGASVIIAPLVVGVTAAAGTPSHPADLALAVPVVLGLLLSYAVGGYVAGRMAGYRTSWHGLMTAFFTLFIVLVVLLAAGLIDRGVFAASGIRSLADILPGASLDTDPFADALSFGAILGFLAAIFGGWLGGLLAPSHAIPAAAPVAEVTPAAPADRSAAEPEPRRVLAAVHSARLERG